MRPLSARMVRLRSLACSSEWRIANAFNRGQRRTLIHLDRLHEAPTHDRCRSTLGTGCLRRRMGTRRRPWRWSWVRSQQQPQWIARRIPLWNHVGDTFERWCHEDRQRCREGHVEVGGDLPRDPRLHAQGRNVCRAFWRVQSQRIESRQLLGARQPQPLLRQNRHQGPRRQHAPIASRPCRHRALSCGTRCKDPVQGGARNPRPPIRATSSIDDQ